MFSSRVSSSFGSASLSRLLLAPLHFHFFPFGADRWGRCPHFVIGLGGCTICPPTTILLLAVLSFLTFPVRPWYERFIHYGDVRKRETAIRHARYPSPPPALHCVASGGRCAAPLLPSPTRGNIRPCSPGRSDSACVANCPSSGLASPCSACVPMVCLVYFPFGASSCSSSFSGR